MYLPSAICLVAIMLLSGERFSRCVSRVSLSEFVVLSNFARQGMCGLIIFGTGRSVSLVFRGDISDNYT